MEMGGSLNVSAPTQDLKYMLASNINVSNFVSVKLSGTSNYHVWKAQMHGLIRSQQLLHIIDHKHPFPKDKGVHTIWQYDNLVKGWIFGSVKEKVLRQLVHFDLSAQHVWRQLEYFYGGHTEDPDSVGFTLGTDSIRDVPELENTYMMRLYEAAVEGCWWKAKSILKIHKNAATKAITVNGNTILHLAVEMGNDYFVEKLLEFLKDGKDIETKNHKGRTALHTAAMVGNINAGRLLVQKRKQLLVIEDDKEQTPFDIAVYNPAFFNKPAILSKSAKLLKTALYPDFVNRDPKDYRMYYTAIFAKQYDLARTLLENYPDRASNVNEMLFVAIILTFPIDLGFTESFIYPSFHKVCKKVVERASLPFHPNFLDECVDDILRVVKICNNMCCNRFGNFSMILFVPIGILFPIYQLIWLLIPVLQLPFSMLYFLMWKVFALLVPPIKNIEKKKQEYQKAREILSLICNQIGESDVAYTKPILEAVRRGTIEIVDEILFSSPDTINCKDEEGHNIIQLAIINRSEKVYNLIYHIIERSTYYRAMRDSLGNNLAHLAGRLAPSSVLERTAGAALQLQRELLWREEVDMLMSPYQLMDQNMDQETPAMVFTREHKDLMKQGEIWMKTTAESCSITAALIVTVVFTAAITVPGGSDQKSGIPVLKDETAFTIFALFNAFSLFTGATSLLLFLSILTARYSERDFLVSLPRRLIFGLLTLFLSTTSMIVAFGAILFLVFCDQRPWMLAPIFGFSCLPISVIVTIKLPLLIDLIKSTYFPIFGKKGYLKSCKINPKNTFLKE